MFGLKIPEYFNDENINENNLAFDGKSLELIFKSKKNGILRFKAFKQDETPSAPPPPSYEEALISSNDVISWDDEKKSLIFRNSYDLKNQRSQESFFITITQLLNVLKEKKGKKLIVKENSEFIQKFLEILKIKNKIGKSEEIVISS